MKEADVTDYKRVVEQLEKELANELEWAKYPSNMTIKRILYNIGHYKKLFRI